MVQRVCKTCMIMLASFRLKLEVLDDFFCGMLGSFIYGQRASLAQAKQVSVSPFLESYNVLEQPFV